jgi:ferrous iron transport protein B
MTTPPLPLDKVRHVAIAGNPNCGKTTIFNALTGLRQRTGNYPGVTVEKKVGRFHGSHGEPMDLLDLPGSYSLQVRSPDEAVARDVLLGRRVDTPRPDVIICVIDAANIERNLYLAAQLLELRIPLIIALNMVDVAESHGALIDVKKLSEQLGVPVVPTIATKGVGLIELKQAISQVSAIASEQHAPMPAAIEQEARALAPQIEVRHDASYSEALLLLTLADREQVLAAVGYDQALADAVVAARARIQEAGCDPVSTPIEARYEWIHRICETAVRHKDSRGLTLSDRLDGWLTHPVFGWLAFLGVMALMFVCIFWVAQVPMDWIDAGTNKAADWVRTKVSDGDFQSLLADGIVPGVGGVVIFLPQILILFFFLGILEDSGYMARAAFIMDRFMARVGLHGKSFIPLLSSFACAIPGIMATRTIENQKDRLVTILVAPLMSCSARLPVYSLMIALLIPVASVWQKAGIMLAMYWLGIAAAFTMAWLFKRTLLKSETPMLLLELPPYRWPAWSTILLRMWERGLIFLRRAGTVILALSILLWALLTYPKPLHDGATPAEAIAQSYGGRMGHAIEPIVAPLGYDWKIGVGLIGSFAAREVFVGTMGIIYNIEDADETSEPLRDTMLAEKHPDGRPVFTPLVCLGLMVFYVLAMQCVSTVAIVRRETNSWSWPIFQIVYMTALAWLGAFVVYQGGRLLGWQ